MAIAISMPSMTFPKTGCLDGPGENQSRLELVATLRKNCDPPELGPGVRHGQGAGNIGILGNVLVLGISAIGACLSCASLEVLESAIGWATGSRAAALRVLGVWAAELVHETWDHAVEVETLVESRRGEVDEVGSSSGDAVKVDFSLDLAHA